MPSVHTITASLSFDEIDTVLRQGLKLKLSSESRKKVADCRKFLDRKLESIGAPVYGINTGFGALYNKSISETELGTLQKNLVMSHACGTGEEVPQEIVKLMLLLKIQGLSYGNSGVQVETIERLMDFLTTMCCLLFTSRDLSVHQVILLPLRICRCR